MRKSIAASLAAALILSTFAPLTVSAQSTKKPAGGPANVAATPTTPATTAIPGMTGKQAQMNRTGKWRHRHHHRNMNYNYGRTSKSGFGTAGGMTNNMLGASNQTVNQGATNAVKSNGTKSSTATTGTKKGASTHHQPTNSKHKTVPTSARHVAKHAGNSRGTAKVTHVSHRR